MPSLYVSVIVTILNREKDIEDLILNLINQSYEHKEIIIIDNGSTDNSKSIIQNYLDKIQFIDASDVIGSPYSARNLGIRKSNGELIAFIDGSPDNNWLKNIIECLVNDELDIVAGKVNFIDPDKDIYTLYDSIFSIDTQYIVQKFKAAPTANLILRKNIFEDIGLFQEDLRSGGDILLTSLATSNGYKIGYCSSAVSHYFSRNKKELIKKQVRIANGQINIWQKQKRNIYVEIIKNILKLIVPENPYSFFKRIKKNHKKINIIRGIQLYLLRNKVEKIRIINCLKLSLHLILHQ